MATTETSTHLTLKELGNNYFRDGNYAEALCKYTEALDLKPSENDRAVIYRNRAACHLKLSNYKGAHGDATAALEVCSNDPKALFRRCQALDAMEKYEDAFKDAVHLRKVDPKNSAVVPILQRLTVLVQQRATKQQDNKVSQMFDYAEPEVQDAEKRIQATNNLVVLSREESGIVRILDDEGMDRLKMLMHDLNLEVRLSVVRTLSNIAKSNKERANLVYECIGLKTMAVYMSSNQIDISNAAAHLLQCIMNSLTGIVEHREVVKKYEEAKRRDKNPRKRLEPFKIVADAREAIDAIFSRLVIMLVDKKVSGNGRDAALELLLKNVCRENDIGWVKEFMAKDGIENTLLVAGTVKEHKTLSITDQTFMHTSVLLHKVYDDMTGDKEREIYRNNCNTYLLEQLGDESMDSKLEAVVAICALLQGPYEVGNSVLGKEGILQMMLTMANSDHDRYQKVAVEALVLSASKKDKCSGIIKEAVPILKSLYGSKKDAIRVRALVGLCKLGSFGGTDASAKSMAEGSTVKLAKACRKFLNHPDRDVDIRKWATEGMAYLTLDGDVKEELVNDSQAIQSIIDLARTSDTFILYPATQIFVNLTNSYDKQEVMPELLEIAKYAKQHIPEDHPKDTAEFVHDRIEKLVKSGVCSALVGLCKTDSHNSRELLSRVFLAIVSEQDHRGVCVQQGGAKTLINLALEGTEDGKAKAGQALAKIAITMNPQFAFPGQRALECIRPLVKLLHYDRTGLQNFEALMALTNLASMNDSVRRRIYKEDDGLSMIHHYMFEEHDLIRRAATQCMCNMVLHDQVVERIVADQERFKLIFLYSGEDEDLELVKAAAGATAILSERPELCKAVVEIGSWEETLKFPLVCEDASISQRAAYIIMNMVHTSEALAQRIVESEILELLMAISRLPEKKEAKVHVDKTLSKLVEYKLIKPYAEQESSA